jgi:hypothetical protein
MSGGKSVETLRKEDIELMKMLAEHAGKKTLTGFLSLVAESSRDKLAPRMPGFKLKVRQTRIGRKRLGHISQAALFWGFGLYALCVSAIQQGRRDARLYLSVRGRPPADEVVQAVAGWLRASGCVVRFKDRRPDCRVLAVSYS